MMSCAVYTDLSRMWDSPWKRTCCSLDFPCVNKAWNKELPQAGKTMAARAGRSHPGQRSHMFWLLMDSVERLSSLYLSNLRLTHAQTGLVSKNEGGEEGKEGGGGARAERRGPEWMKALAGRCLCCVWLGRTCLHSVVAHRQPESADCCGVFLWCSRVY